MSNNCNNTESKDCTETEYTDAQIVKLCCIDAEQTYFTKLYFGGWEEGPSKFPAALANIRLLQSIMQYTKDVDQIIRIGLQADVVKKTPELLQSWNDESALTSIKNDIEIVGKQKHASSNEKSAPIECETQDTEAYTSEMGTASRKLYEAIDSVIILEGQVRTDDAIWRFKIADKIIDIPCKELAGTSEFKHQYLKRFGRPLKGLRKDDWETLLDALAATKSTTVKNNEESSCVFIANEVFFRIKQIAISQDEAAASTGRCLLERDDKLLIISRKVGEIARDMGYTLPLNTLSETMADLGLKTESTRVRKVNKKDTRVWEFYRSKFNETVEEGDC